LSDSIISIEGLGFSYPGAHRPSLTDIHLQIPRGKIFGVLGPNGAGKSTLLSILSGILPLQSGRVCIGDYDLDSQLSQIKKISAMVPQEYAFYEQLTARENLMFFAGLLYAGRQVRIKQVEAALQTCQLKQVSDQISGRFSGGLKRRLNLAIGLLGKPEILYLDEPTVGIDAQSRRFILEKILALREEGMSILYTSHYFEEVEKLCDAAVIIDQGKVIYRRDEQHRDELNLEQRFLQLTQVD
jgi:ABC-2 type transport system ATP-binding protein